jgi:hypothetical protein
MGESMAGAMSWMVHSDLMRGALALMLGLGLLVAIGYVARFLVKPVLGLLAIAGLAVLFCAVFPSPSRSANLGRVEHAATNVLQAGRGMAATVAGVAAQALDAGAVKGKRRAEGPVAGEDEEHE